jgi:sterol desaturase/sphingolipid hydroxylase (fatty acid hydroxylase superfamily)
MKTTFVGKRNKRGDWKPEKPLEKPDIWSAAKFLRFMFGYPGYLFPWGVVYMAFPIVTWLWLTPPMEEMKTFQVGWVAYLLIRNAVMIFLWAGAWHLWLHVKKMQGTDFKYSNKWFARDNPIFMFKNQLFDNLFWTFASGVPIWTAFEAVTLWGYANNYFPYVDWREHPIYCTALMLLTPIIRETHFYLIHRLIHWGPLYDHAHRIHHNNVDVGPFTGLSMHPVEHFFYWTGVLIHFVIPSHPIHALFHIQHAAFSPVQGHAGFSAVVLREGVEVQTGDYFHYLHHRYFECNYGGDGPVMLDKVFGTFHNGTDEATEAMNERFLARAKQKQAGGG